MKKTLLIALLAAGCQAQAQQAVNYNYLEMGYDYLDTDRSNADGFNLEGSFAVSSQTYLGGFFKNLDGDFIDFNRCGIFGGYHQSMTNSTDFFVQLELGQLDLRRSEEFTYGIGIGTRTAVTESFELNTKLAYTEVNDISDGYFEAEIQGLFNLTETVALSADIKSFDGNFGAGVGVRFNF